MTGELGTNVEKARAMLPRYIPQLISFPALTQQTEDRGLGAQAGSEFVFSSELKGSFRKREETNGVKLKMGFAPQLDQPSHSDLSDEETTDTESEGDDVHCVEKRQAQVVL